MYRQNRMKQIALRAKSALWNITALIDELITIIEINERDEALERLNGRENEAVDPDSGGTD